MWRGVWTRRGHHRARRGEPVRTQVCFGLCASLVLCVHIWCAFKRSVLGVWFWGLLSDGFAPERDRSTSARAAASPAGDVLAWRGLSGTGSLAH